MAYPPKELAEQHLRAAIKFADKAETMIRAKASPRDIEEILEFAVEDAGKAHKLDSSVKAGNLNYEDVACRLYLLDAAVCIRPDASPDELNSGAQALVNLLAIQPKNIDALLMLARTFQQLGDLKQADEAISQVLQEDPTNEEARRLKRKRQQQFIAPAYVPAEYSSPSYVQPQYSRPMNVVEQIPPPRTISGNTAKLPKQKKETSWEELAIMVFVLLIIGFIVALINAPQETPEQQTERAMQYYADMYGRDHSQ